MKKRLMVQLKGGRTFFTHQANLPMLIEFAKTFNAQIFTVETDSKEILELSSLATAFCDQNYDVKDIFRSPKRVYPAGDDTLSKWSKRIINANQIQEYIRKQMLDGLTVSLKQLKQHFADLKVTDACLSNHFSRVRKILNKEGFTVEKLGAGMYHLS